MSAPTTSAGGAAGKATISDKATEANQKPAAALEQDDEFEDFPVDGSLAPLFFPFRGPIFPLSLTRHMKK